MTSRPPLPQSVIDAFDALATNQRGEPEEAMRQAVHVMGGGVLSHAIEHIGDLTHRMAERIAIDYQRGGGHRTVQGKVDSVLRGLRNSYGFRREVMENIAANARYHKMDLNETLRRSRLTEALTRYADAHARLKVYNPTQWTAREAAVALGRLDFERAERLLTVLERRLVDEDTWWEAATKFKLDRDGRPMVFVMRREKN